ncbi:hypothetical protein QQ045_003802 [Rhodiola kirilowii]
MALFSQWRSTTCIHVMAVDGIVTVNSLFTIAVVLGLTSTDRPQRHLSRRSSQSSLYSRQVHRQKSRFQPSCLLLHFLSLLQPCCLSS